MEIPEGAHGDGTWDGEPRACAPTQELIDSEVSVLGTAEHAKNSPLPYVLAIYKVGGINYIPLPLYYVSEKAAKLRPGVMTGWYTPAKVGCGFQVRVSAPQENFTTINGKKPGKNAVINVELEVDTVLDPFVHGKGKGHEYRSLGYVESDVFKPNGEGTRTFRALQFKGTETMDDDAGQKPAFEGGSAVLRV